MGWIHRNNDYNYDLYFKALKNIEHKLHNISEIALTHKNELEKINQKFTAIHNSLNNFSDKTVIKQFKKALNNIEFFLAQANKKIPIELLQSQLTDINESIKVLEQKINLNEFNRKLNKIDENINAVKAKGNNYYITIERLDINSPKLDSLSFNLDNLDVKDLSGNLTIGTHIGTKSNKPNTNPE